MRTLACIALLFVTADLSAWDYAREWNVKLSKTAQLLKAGSYSQALPELDAITAEMLGTLGPDEKNTYFLVVPLIQRAIAEAGMGDERAAVWHWHMAQTLDPRAAGANLSAFGEPGALLQRHLLASPRMESCAQEHPKGMVLPKALRTVEPQFPEGSRLAREKGIVIIDVTVGADGVPREPRLIKPLSGSLSYSAMDAVRQWTFAPATLDGKPAETTFCLTINFKLD